MLISCDGSALEWRGAVEISGDPVGLKEILNKEDIHSNNQHTFNLPSRLIAKVYLFRTIFNRGNGYAFSKDPLFMEVSTSVKYWDTVGEKFYNKYKHLDLLYDKNLALIAQGKPIVGVLGREWLIPLVTNFKGELDLPVTKAINYEIQGTMADVMALARVSFNNRLKKSPYIDKTLLLSTIHDSIIVDAPKAYTEPLVKMFHEVFRDLPKNIKNIFGYDWKVPLACEVKAGMDMKNMKEIKYVG